MPTHPGWPDADARHYRQAGYWRGRTFGALLRDWAMQWPDRTALMDGNRRWTFADLDATADQLAGALARLGIRRGDRVVLQLPNRAEFVLLWFGLQRLGAVPVHAMPGHRRSEIGHLLRSSGAVAYIVVDRHARFDYRELAAEILCDPAGELCLRHVVVIGDPGRHTGFVAFADLLAGPGAATKPHDERVRPGDLALLLLSGGTTGLPKLVPRTHDDYAYNAVASAHAAGLTEDSVYLAVLPIGFNFTFACPGALGALSCGGTVVLAPDPSPQTAFGLIERERVTITALSPPLVPHWLDEFRTSRPSLDTLRVLQVGGARLAEDVARQVDAELGVTLQQVFGMAEGLINMTRLDDPPDLIHTTQGRPISPADEILVVDTDDHPVPDGDIGELLTRGPYTVRGYYQAEAHNRTAFTAQGFYRTGDLVRRLPSGHLVVVGRSKDQINRGGEKIAAVEVEEHLVTYPAVVAAAVVGIPDDSRGERTVAFLVCSDRPPTTRELARFLAERGLAAYKAPDQVVAVTRLPMTPVGKVDKNALMNQLLS
ncbi:MAG TPA: (2,3-dihydroxybenzoyl)adenylate synthase [Streptosporangiaceae bacterium]|jgi:2,3-dihydroxybenzoate-AMP ligase|nr:(2,3-dihydroxybenzoyl)adenylate synthase [Streptosporangiaceae bacterium]